MQERTEGPGFDWRRPFWIAFLVAVSVAFSLRLACLMPFAAIGAVAACTLPRRDAYYLTGAAWLVNQAVGFAFLGYPLDLNCFAWGAALGLCAMLCTTAALQIRWLLSAKGWFAREVVAFLTAFLVYEATLIAFTFPLGGIEKFTLAIQMEAFKTNGLAWVGLLGLSWAGSWIGVGYAPRLGAK